MLSVRNSSVVAIAALMFSTLCARAQQPAASPPAVSTESVTRQTVPLPSSLPALVVASRNVEIRARTDGILLQRLFDEGARVQAGDDLFRIDPRPLEAEVALAEAQLQQAQAQAGQTRRAEQRQRQLARSGTATQAALDDAISQREVAEASVAQSQARLDTARLSLAYTDVKAPAAGVTSLEQVPEGSLVSSGDLLTRITQLDPIYVTFSASDSEYASIRDLVERGAAVPAPEGLKVAVRFGDGSTYDRTGHIDFTSSTIDQATGTVRSRAVLPNPDDRLLPGQFVRVEISGVNLKDAITIPAEALMQGPQGTFVYVVDRNNKANVTPVRTSRNLGTRLVVESGIDVGDTVITKGVMRVRPGAVVAPVNDPHQKMHETAPVGQAANGAAGQ